MSTMGLHTATATRSPKLRRARSSSAPDRGHPDDAGQRLRDARRRRQVLHARSRSCRSRRRQEGRSRLGAGTDTASRSSTPTSPRAPPSCSRPPCTGGTGLRPARWPTAAPAAGKTGTTDGTRRPGSSATPRSSPPRSGSGTPLRRQQRASNNITPGRRPTAASSVATIAAPIWQGDHGPRARQACRPWTSRSPRPRSSTATCSRRAPRRAALTVADGHGRLQDAGLPVAGRRPTSTAATGRASSPAPTPAAARRRWLDGQRSTPRPATSRPPRRPTPQQPPDDNRRSADRRHAARRERRPRRTPRHRGTGGGDRPAAPRQDAADRGRRRRSLASAGQAQRRLRPRRRPGHRRRGRPHGLGGLHDQAHLRHAGGAGLARRARATMPRSSSSSSCAGR